jgi:hypothetical protein
MTFVQHDDMAQAISPDAADQAFHKGILPGTSRGREHLFDAHAFYAPLELAPIDRISIPQQILWCRIPRERLYDLLTSPLGGWRLRDIEVHYPATMMREDHQDKQQLESHGWHYKEIDRYQIRNMILQKSLPRR